MMDCFGENLRATDELYAYNTAMPLATVNGRRANLRVVNAHYSDMAVNEVSARKIRSITRELCVAEFSRSTPTVAGQRRFYSIMPDPTPCDPVTPQWTAPVRTRHSVSQCNPGTALFGSASRRWGSPPISPVRRDESTLCIP